MSKFISRQAGLRLALATLVLLPFALGSCADDAPTSTPETSSSTSPVADIVSVEASGETNAYRFAVGVESPDMGCEQYADWWEVLTPEGELVYRRILAHSHVEEQPFVRSGGPIEIGPGDTVLIRAHMNPGGYGGVAFQGTVQDGFQPTELEAGFAAELEEAPPQPSGCAF